MTSDDFPKSPAEFFTFAKKHQAEMVDLKFVDMLGNWQHCSFPIEHLDADTFEEGLGFDGSSIRGWMGIHESDMMAVPDATTARLDPFFSKPTVSVLANVVDPLTRRASRSRTMTAPSAPAANNCVIYAEDNGSGKTQLMVKFASGNTVQLGIET